MAVVACAALLPAAGCTALAPHPPAPQGVDGGAFGGLVTVRLVEGGAQARTVNDRRRGSRGLVPCWLYKGQDQQVSKDLIGIITS